MRLGKQEIRLERQIRGLIMNDLVWLLKGLHFLLIQATETHSPVLNL